MGSHEYVAQIPEQHNHQKVRGGGGGGQRIEPDVYNCFSQIASKIMLDGARWQILQKLWRTSR